MKALLEIPWAVFAVLLGLLLIFLLYWEENVRGANEWAKTASALRAKGEVLDFKALIPPPVPDAQNLGVIPLFKVDSAGSADYPEPVALADALKKTTSSTEALPKSGDWQSGKPADMAAIQKYFAACYHEARGTAASPPATLETIDLLCPALKDLRDASATRPQFRLEEDYTTQPPGDRSLALIMKLLSVAKILNMHAIAALHENQPALALDDARLDFKLAGGPRREPVLISGLIGLAMVQLQLSSVWEGLCRHAWNDEQLSQLQAQLREIDYLSDYQLCLHGEATGVFAQINDYLQDHPVAAADLIPGVGTYPSFSGALPSPRRSAVQALVLFIPSGWYSMSKARGVALYFEAARTLSNPGAHRSFPQKADDFRRRLESGGTFDLPDLLVRMSAGSVIPSIKQFTRGQATVDMAYIACALERFRLARGSYPENLNLLAPYAAASLPHDPITGAPYHYRLEKNGAYLLYSVGWNQIDDGGRVVYRPGSDHVVDTDLGDWIWKGDLEANLK